MLQIERISKNFGRFQALHPIDTCFLAGDSVALLGPNGSGKTTLIKTILGLVSPSHGHIAYQGMRIPANALKELVGYMPQIGQYPENMKVSALFKLMLSLRGKSINDCDTKLYHAFDMDAIGHKTLGTLSGGTRQKVGAALAFLFHPRILILDEPTAGLDPHSSAILKEHIASFQSNDRLVIITSHVISELNGLVNKVMYMMEGRIHFYMGVQELVESTGQAQLEKALVAAIGQNTIKERKHVDA
ncbi:MAG: ABC transporter ATP-binding protein [Bacteroidetes bacterium]|jgi:Cu-processing system ATP-binding protein|nr:ABC transporter ATP-binding protein [Bacteroidota bacterium]